MGCSIRKKGLDSGQLKLIAIAAMTVDHLTWVLAPGLQKVWWVLALHAVGRITAPVMWFFIAEGCHYTRDIKKYALRMALFAAVSHFAYCFAFGVPLSLREGGIFNRTSVMLPLCLAVILIAVIKNERTRPWMLYVCIFLACAAAFPADWSSIAVMAPVFLYLHREDRRKQPLDIILWSAVYGAVYFFCLDRTYGLLQMCTALSVPFLLRYNGRRGARGGMKWLFYIYYPANLFVTGIIRILLHGDVPVIF